MKRSPVLILLAGGRSSRMGSPKGLLDYAGKPWIIEQISRFKCVQNAKVYIGLGYDHEKYVDAIPWFKKAMDEIHYYNGIGVRVLINDKPENGAFSTLQKVLGSIDPQETIIVQPIDVPLLNEESLRSLINETNVVVIPTCDGQNGHPVMLMPDFWLPLKHIDISSEKARLDCQISDINISSITYLKVPDNSVYQNINKQEDWINYLDLISKNNFK